MKNRLIALTINLPRFNRKTPKSPYASRTLEYVPLIASFSADAIKKRCRVRNMTWSIRFYLAIKMEFQPKISKSKSDILNINVLNKIFYQTGNLIVLPKELTNCSGPIY